MEPKIKAIIRFLNKVVKNLWSPILKTSVGLLRVKQEPESFHNAILICSKLLKKGKETVNREIKVN